MNELRVSRYCTATIWDQMHCTAFKEVYCAHMHTQIHRNLIPCQKSSLPLTSFLSLLSVVTTRPAECRTVSIFI